MARKSDAGGRNAPAWATNSTDFVDPTPQPAQLLPSAQPTAAPPMASQAPATPSMAAGQATQAAGTNIPTDPGGVLDPSGPYLRGMDGRPRGGGSGRQRWSGKRYGDYGPCCVLGIEDQDDLRAEGHQASWVDERR